MSLEFAIDWLNYTALDLGTRTLTAIAYPVQGGNWQPENPAKGYNRGLKNDYGCRLSWHNSRDDMGAHVQYSGSVLNKYRENGIYPTMIAAHHHANHDRCTRIDLALDVKGEGLNIGGLANAVKSGNADVKVKSYSHILSQDGGETLYLGSRQSEQFIRIYNKAAETNMVGDWVRIELECKGSRSMEIGNRLAMDSEIRMTALTKGLIRNLANFDDSVWQAVVGNMSIAIAKAHEKEPDTRGWLLGSVAPAMAKYIRDTGDEAIIEQFLAVLDAFIRFR